MPENQTPNQNQTPDNTQQVPSNNPVPAQANNPVQPQPNTQAVTPQAAPVQAAQNPVAAQTTQPQQPAASAPVISEVQKLKKAAGASNKKLMFILIFGLFGFIFFAFIILYFLISQSTDPQSNPFIQIFGINPEDWIPFLINLTNAGFGFLVFISFIVAIIGIFKIAMSKKDDKPARLKGGIMTGVAAVLFILFIVVWMFTYLNLSGKKADTGASKDYIVTEPAQTLDLTAPLKISFDAANIERMISKSKYQILSYEWDFGDSSDFATGKSVDHLYTQKGPNGGRYKVVLTVTYKEIKTGEEMQEKFEKDIVFSNEAALTDFIASPVSGSAPLTVTFDASLSIDNDGSIEKYEWDMDEDGFFDDGQGEQVEYTFSKVGTFTAKLRITDSNGDSSFAEKDIEVTEGENPVAVINVNSEEGNFFKGKSYLFDANRSSSPVDAKIVKYLWDFGDGNLANTRTASHSFANLGTYPVKLTITDENGLKGEDTFEIKIEQSSSAPSAKIKPTPAFTDSDETYIEGQAPFSVSFSGVDSTDPDDDIVEYNWDFDGDGNSDDTGEIASYVFKEEGEYNVTLTVIDSEENESKDTVVVKVLAHGIEAFLTANVVEGEVPLKVVFDASGSVYPEGKIISYEWDFGNGVKRVDISQITYTYESAGTYTASVTAVAADGSTSKATVVVSVRPISVKACIEANPEIGESPLDVKFDASCSGGSVAYYLWDFGNGKTSRDRKPTTTYTKPGTYKVTLEVRDQNGITSTVKKDIVVTGKVE